MKAGNALLLALIVIVVLFAVFNWTAIGTPLPVRYFLGSGELPLGVILLAMFAIMVVFHVVSAWLRAASSAVDKWITARELNEALERAMESDDDRISRLAKHFDEQHRALESKLDSILDRLDAVKLAKVIEKETADVSGRIRDAEKGIRKDIRKSHGRFRRK